MHADIETPDQLSWFIAHSNHCNAITAKKHYHLVASRNLQICKQAGRQAVRQAGRQPQASGRQAGKQAGRQAGKQARK